ncbi:conserved Plasmodium protein, unknown function [Plasmodium malariae]|uniref:Uncharacterized protein n=1 Tax=Plasmodium malariae TaxID=5858 RepID=A0A1C3KFY8_PLAMA|nr:conserved Plasmodium protein, unknown function [Plasmodium malariae]
MKWLIEKRNTNSDENFEAVEEINTNDETKVEYENDANILENESDTKKMENDTSILENESDTKKMENDTSILENENGETKMEYEDDKIKMEYENDETKVEYENDIINSKASDGLYESSQNGNVILTEDEVKHTHDTFNCPFDKSVFEAPKFYPHYLMKDHTLQYLDPVIKKTKRRSFLCCCT